MKIRIKHIPLLISLLALAISACDVQGVNARGIELIPGAQMEPRTTPDDSGPTDVESSSSSAVAEAPVADSIEEVPAGDIPSLEEREAMLDGVNLAPPIEGDAVAPVPAEKQPPGTESGGADSTSGSMEGESGPTDDFASSIISQIISMLSSWLQGFFN